MTLTEGVFLAQVASTLVLVGLIWVVQCVHYPLFSRVGRAQFAAYHHEHGRRITTVVGPLMIVEMISALMLFFYRPAFVPVFAAWLGAGLLALAWLSTAFLQVPRHAVLAHGFDDRAFRFLVRSNWLRTAAWTLRGSLVVWMVGRGLGPVGL